jgi:hypothetical protein
MNGSMSKQESMLEIVQATRLVIMRSYKSQSMSQYKNCEHSNVIRKILVTKYVAIWKF